MESQSQTQTQTQTQASKAGSKKRPVKNDKLSLEDYLDFLHTHQTLNLTMNHLNQIIHIHGFKKLHRHSKKVLVEAVDALDLMDLARSTLSQSVSAFATLTLEDAIADLNELSWQECCVTSIYNISSCTENFPPPCQNLHANIKHLQITKASEKTRSTNEFYNLLPEASQNDLRATKMVPKRKRLDGDALDCASTMDSVSLASN
ncbi:uncharacterized protein G2W53_008784 [Senna tora]|uniref:DUF7787 domain-containing protein n=1 Tax=Senna tora TaxID=362788 RepID=A0A835C918_9FABA|nr:uncharacterized protein G2W53_008784 [Senna tora]